MIVAEVKETLLALGNKEKSDHLKRFFKTGEGQYGERDIFIGVTVPENRKLAKQYKDLPLESVIALLRDPIHECRLFALLTMIEQFNKGDAGTREMLYQMYLAHTDYINNWDLVDLSAYQIVGRYLEERDHTPLYDLAQSGHLWQQRISIVATWEYIRKRQFTDTLQLAHILLCHPHDLIQKAVGWMLREVGKRDKDILVDFLSSRYREMPRTMLRYSIEKFTSEERAFYLTK